MVESNNISRVVEGLTDKTIKSSDKLKVARVIADMLGVEKAESMSPDMAVAAGLRKTRNIKLTPEFASTIKKMIALARDVGVNVDDSILPPSLKEATVVPLNKTRSDNGGRSIVRASDFVKLTKLNQGVVPISGDHSEVGNTLHPDDTARKMRVKQHDESVEIDEDLASADYKVNPMTGRKYRAKRIDFKNSGSDVEADHDKERKPVQTKPMIKFHEEAELEDFDEEDLDDLADDVDHEDDILDLYDDDELFVVDTETGEEIKEELSQEATQQLDEVLSRIERMKAKVRFARTTAKRARKLQIALRTRSSTKKINDRSRRLAVKLIKQRIIRKPIAQMTVPEKERAEKIIQRRKALIDRLAMKLAPRIRKIENDRLSHHTTRE